MQSYWSREFSIVTQELDFSKIRGFDRFSMVKYHLKPRNHIYEPNLSSKSVLRIFFRALRA